MAKQKFEKFVIQHFMVTGRGEFPYDMLRYDSCCPYTERDARMLDQDFARAVGENSAKRTVTLKRFSINGDGPTVARWTSFGWDVDFHWQG